MPRTRTVPSRKSVGNTRSPEAKDAIVEAAADLLTNEGLENFTIEGVARAARSGKPTIYKWWGDKRQLAYDVFAQTFPIAAPDTEQANSVYDEISILHTELWKLWNTPKLAELSRHLIADAQRDVESIEIYRDQYFSRRQEPLLQAIKDGIARGELPEATDVDTVAQLLAGFHMLRLLLNLPVDNSTIERVLTIVLGGTALYAKTCPVADAEK